MEQLSEEHFYRLKELSKNPVYEISPTRKAGVYLTAKKNELEEINYLCEIKLIIKGVGNRYEFINDSIEIAEINTYPEYIDYLKHKLKTKDDQEKYAKAIDIQYKELQINESKEVLVQSAQKIELYEYAYEPIPVNGKSVIRENKDKITIAELTLKDGEVVDAVNMNKDKLFKQSYNFEINNRNKYTITRLDEYDKDKGFHSGDTLIEYTCVRGQITAYVRMNDEIEKYLFPSKTVVKESSPPKIIVERVEEPVKVEPPKPSGLDKNYKKAVIAGAIIAGLSLLANVGQGIYSSSKNDEISILNDSVDYLEDRQLYSDSLLTSSENRNSELNYKLTIQDSLLQECIEDTTIRID